MSRISVIRSPTQTTSRNESVTSLSEMVGELLAAVASALELSSIHLELGLTLGVTPGGIEKLASDDRWALLDKWLV